MAQSHIDNVEITILLDPPPKEPVSFSTLLLLADQDNGTTLDGDRVRKYTTPRGVDQDVTDGFLFSAVAEGVKDALSNGIGEAWVGRVDTANATPETFLDGYNAALNAGVNPYGVAIESRLDADILNLESSIEATTSGIMPRLFSLQSDDADWKTLNFPAGLTALEGNERSIIHYHDDDTQFQDFAWLAALLRISPDTRSSPGDLPVVGISGLTTEPSAAEKGFLDDNFANHGLPYGGANFFVDPGVNAAGRPIYEIVTRDWFHIRLQERTAAEKVKYSNRNQKISLDARGQAIVSSILFDLFDEGATAGHFLPGQRTVNPLPITDSDKAAQRMRIEAAGTYAVNTRKFNYTINLTRSNVVEDD